MDLCRGQFLVGILLAVITPLIGMTVVLKRMSMVGDALAHASLAGVAIGMLVWNQPGSRSRRYLCGGSAGN